MLFIGVPIMKIIAGMFLVVLSIGVFTYKNNSSEVVEPVSLEEKEVSSPKKKLKREPSLNVAPEIVSNNVQQYVSPEDYSANNSYDPNDCVNNPGSETCNQGYTADETVQYDSTDPDMSESVYTPDESVETPEYASESGDDETVMASRMAVRDF
jgi:hypothetical protein